MLSKLKSCVQDKYHISWRKKNNNNGSKYISKILQNWDMAHGGSCDIVTGDESWIHYRRVCDIFSYNWAIIYSYAWTRRFNI